MALNQTRFRLRAGESAPLAAPAEALDFTLRAVERRVTKGFAVGPNVSGDQALLAASVTTPPGEYPVTVSAVSETGEERTATVMITVTALPTVPSTSTVPPVILLNGWQFSLGGSCPISASSADTFGSLAQQLQQAPNSAPVVYFFDNCVESPRGLIEDLGNTLGQFLSLIKHDDGTPVTQFDLVGHSMGGLIARAFLSGLQVNQSLSPPANPRIRKLVEIATPNFGAFLAASYATFLDGQAREMVPGSPFLWNLSRWNQGADDLRGVDALAIIGNAGPIGNQPNASDGVVSLTSGSLGFARDPSRTRILSYCHTAPNVFVNCLRPGIANVDSAPETGQIVVSFIAGDSRWMSMGSTPAADPLLSQFGGIYFGLQNAAGTYVSDLSQVSWGSATLLEGGASKTIFYNEFVKGTDTFQATSASQGKIPCGPFTEPAGGFLVFRCKFTPIISSVTPLVPGVTAQVVASGAIVTLHGSGFGTQCSTCQVSASPGSVLLQVSSWSDQAISVFLPAAFNGLVVLRVQTASGADSINILAQSGVSVTSVVNAASSSAGAIAPGEIVAIKGSGLGPATGVSFSVNAAGMVDTTLAETRVFFSGFAAPITYTSATQINAIVPYEIAGQSQVAMQIEYLGVKSAATTLQVAKASPASFTFSATGTGQAVAANADGSFNGPSTPAPRGAYVIIYFTGGGQTDPPGVTGSVTGLVQKNLTEKISVKVGGQAAIVQFAGAAPTFVDGVGQLNIKLADNTPSGPAQPLVITVADVSSPETATIAVAP